MERSPGASPLRIVKFEPVTKTEPATRPYGTSTKDPRMSEMARQIIRQHWHRRHDPDPLVRERALTLVKAHVILLRKWRGESRLAS